MKRTRSMFRVNTDIPGALEIVHPNKFIASKFIRRLFTYNNANVSICFFRFETSG